MPIPAIIGVKSLKEFGVKEKTKIVMSVNMVARDDIFVVEAELDIMLAEV